MSLDIWSLILWIIAGILVLSKRDIYKSEYIIVWIMLILEIVLDIVGVK